MTRVSDAMFFSSLSRGVGRAEKRAYAAQTRAQTGLRVNKPSDDPVVASRASVMRAQLARLDTMDHVSARAATQLAASGRALDETISIVSTVRTMARSAAGGTVDTTGMSDLAVNVAAQQTALLATANTSTDAGYVFGGYLDQSPPFQATGAYVGDAGVRSVEVAPGQRVATGVSGAQAFTAAGGQDVFAVVEAVRVALAAGDRAAATAQLGAIDGALAQLKAARVQVGASADAVKGADASRVTARNQLQTSYDLAMKIDDATASVDMLAAQNALEAATRQASSVLSMLASLQR